MYVKSEFDYYESMFYYNSESTQILYNWLNSKYALQFIQEIFTYRTLTLK